MTISDRYFQRVVLAAMATGVLLLAIAGVATVYSVRRSQQDTAWVAHSYEVQGALARFSILSEQLETARRGYILQQNPLALRTYAATTAQLPRAIERIAAMTRDNPGQQRRLVDLRTASDRHRASARRSIAQMQSRDAATRALADFEVDSSFARMWALRAIVDAMTHEEARLLARRAAGQAASATTLYLVLGITGGLMVAVMGGAYWIVLRYTADLSRAQDALLALNAGLEDAVVARTAELSRANDEIQRFAYIVSHDLRSPLVNVMGFTAELETTIAPLTTLIDRVDAEAPALMTDAARDAKTDLPEAIQFIRSSTNKMDRLINAILRLSREGRRTLQPVAIDLGAMLAAIRDSFQHRLTATGTEFDVGGPFPPLVSDRLALEQILSNLIENAVKYLQPGRPGRIVVSASTAGPRVVIAVADNGRGIAPADHERIFELFRRSGAQDQPGEGLGLAHVRALSYRLGGVINCISSLGTGATFQLSLPRVLEPEAIKESVR